MYQYLRILYTIYQHFNNFIWAISFWRDDRNTTSTIRHINDNSGVLRSRFGVVTRHETPSTRRDYGTSVSAKTVETMVPPSHSYATNLQVWPIELHFFATPTEQTSWDANYKPSNTTNELKERAHDANSSTIISRSIECKNAEVEKWSRTSGWY